MLHGRLRCGEVQHATFSRHYYSLLYQGEHMPEQLRKAFGIQKAGGGAETEALEGGKAVQGKAMGKAETTNATDAELES